VVHVDLPLTEAPLALLELQLDVGAFEPVAQAAEEGLGEVARRDQVVGVVPGGRLQRPVLARPRLLVAAAVEVELELAADLGLVAELGEPADLTEQHRTRRDRHLLARFLPQVGEAEGNALMPGERPQGREVRHQDQVVPAGVEARVLERQPQFLVDVPGQHAGADVEPGEPPAQLLGRHPPAEQAPLHVGRRDHHRADALALQLLERKRAHRTSQPPSTGRCTPVM